MKVANNYPATINQIGPVRPNAPNSGYYSGKLIAWGGGGGGFGGPGGTPRFPSSVPLNADPNYIPGIAGQDGGSQGRARTLCP